MAQQKQMTKDEEKAWRRLARAARELREAQTRAERGRQMNAHKGRNDD
jgi:hypothetical protein